ncbi:ABC transporter substrate-binding protein [Clostridium senegalense]|uniref:ABC transporter substrate-binding protein n=1 Tax=Clostridium senegalense TaxID=1465809 RepID=A0A6M0H5W5_9CLOT|nr:ABC transporter substrate-binding protein [Clostridium senegalense]NEU05917.1 ABC transporter substrate-binding protein [Clostridium senegalense]
MKFKKLTALVTSCILTLGLIGCGNSAETSTNVKETESKIATEIKDPVSIEFWHAMNGENEKVLQEITEEFNKKNDGKITVNLVYQGHYKELFSKLEGASKSNQLPALSMIYPNRLTAYVMNDLVENLNPYIENEKIGFSKDSWNDIPEFLRDNGMWNEKHYSLPFNKSTYLLFYNEDLLKEKNVKVPTNWNELKDAAKTLTVDKDNDGTTDTVGLALNSSVGIDSSFWVEQAGGHLIDEANDKILFNSQETAEAFDFLAGMVKDGSAKVCTEEKYMTGPFGRGEAAMGISSISALPDIIKTCSGNNINFKTAVLPENKQKAALFAGTDVTIFNTPSPEEKLAAFEFIKFFMEEENQLTWGTKSGYLPLRKSVLESNDFKNYVEKKNPAKGVAVEEFDYGYCDPKVLNGYSIHENMNKALQQILLEEKDTKAALDEAETNTRKALDEAKKSFGN